MTTYACAAVTGTGARCRFFAVNGSKFCSRHAKGATLANRVDRVLLKANINERWVQKFLYLGAQEVQQDEVAKDLKHAAHAKVHGRQANAIRTSVPDSGVPVFGKEGARAVEVETALRELLATYKVVNVHIRARRDQNRWMRVLVTVFDKAGEQAISEPVLNALREFYGCSSWGFCHVWANPPQEDGTVVHTVNLSHRGEKNQANLLLRLMDGLWDVENI